MTLPPAFLKLCTVGHGRSTDPLHLNVSLFWFCFSQGPELSTETDPYIKEVEFRGALGWTERLQHFPSLPPHSVTIHSFIHYLSNLPPLLLVQSFILLFIHPCIYPFIHALVHICSFTYPLFIHLPTHSFSHSFIHTLIHAFASVFIHEYVICFKHVASGGMATRCYGTEQA